MAKISDFADGGAPQNADEFAVARVGSNFKITWLNILTLLGTIYAAIANSVTGGDSHDHNGGDGAQINHTALSNIGTNTHAQIDAFLAVSGSWTTVKKTADESVSLDTTLSTDGTLQFTATANKTYAVRGRIWFSTAATPDFKYRFAFAGTSMWILHTSYPAGSSTPTVTNDNATPGTTVALLGAAYGGYIEFDGVLVCDGSARVLGFQWAQNTSDAANTTVNAGSYLEYIQVN